MFPPLFASLFFAQVALATSDNATITGCPTPDATTYNRRSVWSLLGSCGLTMLICVWHAVHPAVPLPHFKWYHKVLYRLGLMIFAFLMPEIVILDALSEWLEARQMTRYVHNSRGYKWWTMTHSHFALNGGFAIRDNTGITELWIAETNDIQKLIDLMDEGKIVNAVVAKADIRDRSKTDALGKAILIMQLSWFTTQVIVRLLFRLTVTLVELDTVCMAFLTLPLLFCWWRKPYCPGCPYVFIKRNANVKADDSVETPLMAEECKELGQSLEIKTKRDLWDLFTNNTNANRVQPLFMCLIWAIFGVLHATAWNYPFPSSPEKILWHASSVVLMGSAVFFAAGWLLYRHYGGFVEAVGMHLQFAFVVMGVLSRLILVVLMLISLRSLPPSSYEIVPWTEYIPHL